MSLEDPRGRDSLLRAALTLPRPLMSMPAAMLVLGYLVGADGLGWVSTGSHSEIVKTTAALMLFQRKCRLII
jgi:hypothetical protein